MNLEADGPGMWPAELEVHAASDGPIAAALIWMQLLQNGQLAEAWVRTDFTFRLFLARHWCWRHRFTLSDSGFEACEVATGLAENGPAHPLWPTFARSQTPDAGPDRALVSGWVAAGPAEPAGPDAEIVRLIPANGFALSHEPPPFAFVLCLRPSGWLVAGHGEAPARPRWPPR